ncbi:MAG TPA: protein-glutamate O-methyltransferase CheR [Chryseolinea sp.]
METVNEEEVRSFTQGILTRYGIDFTCYEPKSLRRRIIRVMGLFDLPTVHDLWVRFLRDPGFIHVFMNEISVGMTSMFRDPLLWRKLEEKLKKEFMLRPSFSVWHAGCSTGEEVYSFSILLHELGMQEKSTALATDFSTAALDEARNGAYDRFKMIENDANYRQVNIRSDFSKYFTCEGDHAIIRPDLRTHVEFRYQNLITDPAPKGFDFIFCRNVMIYFDSTAKINLLDKFYEALNPGGYFIIGFFDTMNYLVDHKKFLLVDDEAKIFRKV